MLGGLPVHVNTYDKNSVAMPGRSTPVPTGKIQFGDLPPPCHPHQDSALSRVLLSAPKIVVEPILQRVNRSELALEVIQIREDRRRAFLATIEATSSGDPDMIPIRAYTRETLIPGPSGEINIHQELSDMYFTHT